MRVKAAVAALGLVLLVVLVSLAVSAWSRQAAVPAASAQPINFPHNVHVETHKIDCQYCHSEARRSEYAGLPSVTRCLGCHRITAADRPEIQKLAQYGAKGEPIPWVRQYKLPEFTHFPHKAHVRAEIKCQTCHGEVEKMTTVAARTGPTLLNDLARLAGFRPAPPPLSMGWCVDCHHSENARRPDKVRAPLDCVSCHH